MIWATMNAGTLLGAMPAKVSVRQRPMVTAGFAKLVDITAEHPKPWTDEIVRAADVVVTMGCGDACPFYPGKRYDDWELDDPAGQGIDAVRPIRDEIEQRVRALLTDLRVTPT